MRLEGPAGELKGPAGEAQSLDFEGPGPTPGDPGHPPNREDLGAGVAEGRRVSQSRGAEAGGAAVQIPQQLPQGGAIVGLRPGPLSPRP